MATTALAASALLSLFLLAAAHRLPSDVHLVPALGSDAAAIRLPSDRASEESIPNPTVADQLLPPSDKPSEVIVPKPVVAEFLPRSKPSMFISERGETATESILPAADSVAGLQSVPIEVSLIPVRDIPFGHPRDVVGRPSWRRLGRHCHHMHRVLRGEVLRHGNFIPYGDDMIVPADQIRRGYEGGRYFAGEARTAGFRHPAMMEEISAADLGKQREMGFPRELRPFRRFVHHVHGDEKVSGLVKRFLDLLNRP